MVLLFCVCIWPTFGRLSLKAWREPAQCLRWGLTCWESVRESFLIKKRLAWRQGPGSGSTKTGNRRTGEVKLLCIGGTTTIKQLAECYLTIVLYKCAYFSYFGKYFLEKGLLKNCTLGSIWAKGELKNVQIAELMDTPINTKLFRFSSHCTGTLIRPQKLTLRLKTGWV